MSALKFAAIVVAFLLGAPLAFAQNAPQPIGPNGGASSGGSSNLTFPATVSGTVNSGGIPYFSSSTGMASSAALTANALVIGGGAGESPAAASGLTYVNSQLLAPSGTLAAPTMSFSAASSYGLYYDPSTFLTPAVTITTNGVSGFEYGLADNGSIYEARNGNVGSWMSLDYGSGSILFNSANNEPISFNAPGNQLNIQSAHLATQDYSVSGPSCGTGCGSVAGTDIDFNMVINSSVTSATVDFGFDYISAPTCVASTDTATAFAYISAVSVSAITIGFSTSLSGDHVTVHCIQ